MSEPLPTIDEVLVAYAKAVLRHEEGSIYRPEAFSKAKAHIQRLMAAERLEAEVTLARKVLAVSGGHSVIKGFTQAKRLQLLTDEMRKIIPETFGDIEDTQLTHQAQAGGEE